jgi:hypothetical protein
MEHYNDQQIPVNSRPFATLLFYSTILVPLRLSEEKVSGTVGVLLRRSIRESGRSVEEIASDAGVSPIVIARFVPGERDIHMATADRLARSLGLEVTAD